jgi:hypothetical protein
VYDLFLEKLDGGGQGKLDQLAPICTVISQQLYILLVNLAVVLFGIVASWLQLKSCILWSFQLADFSTSEALALPSYFLISDQKTILKFCGEGILNVCGVSN